MRTFSPSNKLSDIVLRHFLHCTCYHGYEVAEIVEQIGIAPGQLCRIIATQEMRTLPLSSFFGIARWLKMSLRNVLILANVNPTLSEILHFAVELYERAPSDTQAQIDLAEEAGISVAVFRRALHGYPDFRPSLSTCERLANWLSWTGLDSEDIVAAAGMVLHRGRNGRHASISPEAKRTIKAYPCACGRPGCLVPAHVPSGRHRKWRSDACRMWAARNHNRPVGLAATKSSPLPHSSQLMRFIVINERRVPVRF